MENTPTAALRANARRLLIPSIGEGADGRAPLHCHAGCELGEVLRTLELNPAGVMPSHAERRPHASSIPHGSSPNGRTVARGPAMAAPGPVFVYAPVTNNISNTTHQGAPSPLRSKLEQTYWVAGILGVIVAIAIAIFTVRASVRPPKLTDGRPSDVQVMARPLDGEIERPAVYQSRR